MSQAFQLYQLQVLDTQIDNINVRLQEIKIALANDSEVKIIEEQKLNAQNLIQKISKRMKAAEDEVEAARIKLEMNNSSLYGGKIQNPKELKDLQNEVMLNKKRLASLEDALLSFMLEMEEAEKELHSVENLLDNALNHRRASIFELDKEKEQLMKDAANLSGKKNMMFNSITPENIELYTRLRSQKRGLAIARIEDDTCSACGSSLTPAERQASRSPTQLVFCSSCGRILYVG